MELLGKFDSVMAIHIDGTLRLKNNWQYLSKDIQNEIIELLGKAVIDRNLSCIKKAKYLSIILNCTSDISRNE